MAPAERIITVADIAQDLKIDPYALDPYDPLGLYNLQAYVPRIVEDLMENGPRSGKVTVVFSDGTSKRLKVRQVILNILIKWRIILALREPLLPSDFTQFTHVTPLVCEPSHKALHEKYRQLPGLHIPRLVAMMFDSVSVLRAFIMTYIEEYASSLSLIKMANIAVHPSVKHLCELTLDRQAGTKIAEERIDKAKNAFLTELTTGDLRHTSVGSFLQASTLNTNQVGQVFIALGPRSDSDDSIIPTPISQSVLQGFNSVQSFATEVLAAKKAAEANKEAVWDAQYFARTGHLAVSILSTLYPGHCGNYRTDTFEVSPDYFNTLVGKNIVEGSTMTTLTTQNITKYIGQKVEILSAMRCRCGDGICRVCAGAAADYVLPQMHLGLTCGSDLFSIITQFILSTKHFIKTNTIEYMLDDFAREWFTVHQSSVSLRDLRFGEKYKLGIVRAEMGSLSSLPTVRADQVDMFSRIITLYVLDQENEPVASITVEHGEIYPWLSAEFLAYIGTIQKQCTVLDNGLLVIPMKKWLATAPVLNFAAFTYDMKQYVNNVKYFLKQGIVRYNDVSTPLKDLSDLIYKKTQVNILLIEVILKALIRSIDLEDPEQPVTYSGLVNAIGEKAITPKFLFQGVFGASEQYITTPDFYTNPRSIGMFGWFFGQPDSEGKY